MKQLLSLILGLGIYLFNRNVLADLLTQFSHTDFGRDIFPHSIRSQHVQAHLFDGYWEDIGTVKSFWKANLDLAADNPPFELDAPDSLIFSHPRFLPPSRISGATIERSLIADGCTIAPGCRIENSIIGLRCRIGRNVQVVNSRGIQNSEDSPTAMICDGTVVVPKEVTLPDGWAL